MIKPLKVWHDITNVDLFFMSIMTYISCIEHELGALEITQKIQVMCSLQVDNLSIVDSKHKQSIRGCSVSPSNWIDDWS